MKCFPNRSKVSGFSFLELIIVSFLFTAGIIGIFPFLKDIRTSQHDLSLRFRALKLAENEICYVQSEVPGPGTRGTSAPKHISSGGETFDIKREFSGTKDLVTVLVTVSYKGGPVTGEVSLATHYPAQI